MNIKLLNCCKEYGLNHIDKSNISVEYLAQDSLYPTERSKKKLSNNFIIF